MRTVNEVNFGSSRREFLKGIAATGIAATFAGCNYPTGSGITRRVALQLWSLNKCFWKSPEKYLDQIKAAGYDGVEFAGYEKRTARQLGKMLANAGLLCAGTHLCGDEEFSGDGLKRNIDFCGEAGIPAMVSAWAGYDNREGWVKFGELMGKAAVKAEKYGIKVSVHNHCDEFIKKYDGQFAWDWIFSRADKRLQLQLDTSQVVNPGQDPVAQIKKYYGRHFSIHLKENTPSYDGYFGVAPDDGGKTVNWTETIRTIEADPSCKWYVVECERRPDSLEPAIFNIDFLRGLRF